MKDILPEEVAAWRRLEELFRSVTERYGFQEVRPPIVEPTELFVRSIGETTDIVEKEMYTFVDKGDKSLTLRPEGTASCVRAYVQHSVGGKEPVTKWYYLGPMYRRERPAKGRYRQFYQGGVEVYGDPGPHIDAEVIDMVVGFVRELGIAEVEVLVNSLGGKETRPKYREALLAYLRPRADKLCADCQRRIDTNPMRVLDCKVPGCILIAKSAPQILDHLGADDRAHFDRLCATLDALGTPYRVDGSLVRGLDYYTRTLFEVRGLGGDLGAQNALLGGGRYDNLVKALGGKDTPAVGFAMGIERLLLAMPEHPPEPHIDVFVVAQPGCEGHAAVLGQELRNAELRVEVDLRGNSIKSQLRRANHLRAPVALILGEAEVDTGTVQLKDLKAQTQEPVPRDQLKDRLKAYKFT